MSFVFWEILIPLIIAFLLGLLFGWFMWGWRRTKITYSEWETMRQKAGRASAVEAETELAELRAERDQLRAEIDGHVCEVAEASLGTGVLGVAAAADGADDSPEGSTEDPAAERSEPAPDAEAPAAEAGAEAHPYGEGSHAPLDDPKAMPDGYTIKGNADSMLYHRPDSRSYAVTIAEVWFDTAERAEANGFALANSHPKDSEDS